MTTIRFWHGKASATLVHINRDLYHLGDVWTEVEDRNQGYAKGVVKKVVDYADQNNITILLRAQRYGKATEPALDNRQLEEFYAKFGFEVTDRQPVKMVRRPVARKTEPIMRPH